MKQIVVNKNNKKHKYEQHHKMYTKKTKSSFTYSVKRTKPYEKIQNES